MSKKTILIKLFQPFAQYRNPFTFYYAQTFPLPPKSTIIGMLQNAVGDWYGSEEGVNKWWDLKVSVHGGFENVFWNYQQLIKGELGFTKGGVLVNNSGNGWLPLYSKGIKSQRSPVYQQELFNGHLYIFVKGNKDLIDKIKNSLINLRKILYLGRSEDIIFIRYVKEIKPIKEEKNIQGDLKLELPTYISLDNLEIEKDMFPVYYLPVKVVFENNKVPVKLKAEIHKDTERNVEYKRVIFTGSNYDLYVNELKEGFELFDVDNRKIKIINNFGWL